MLNGRNRQRGTILNFQPADPPVSRLRRIGGDLPSAGELFSEFETTGGKTDAAPAHGNIGGGKGTLLMTEAIFPPAGLLQYDQEAWRGSEEDPLRFISRKAGAEQGSEPAFLTNFLLRRPPVARLVSMPGCAASQRNLVIKAG